MRDRRLEIAGVVVIAVAGVAVWAMRHPGSGLVERATRWPVVGPAAHAVRERFLPRAAVPPPPAPEPEIESFYRIESDGPSPGRPALEWPPAGTASPKSEVRHFASRDAVEPVGPLPASPADGQRLESALARLGSGAERHPVGPYTLWTDVADPQPLLARWRALVADSERAWTARYGVAPLGEPAETIVLFARESDFLGYAAESGIGLRDANGVSGWGIVALAAEGRAAGELDGILQHEIGHLLARRSIGPALPPWLAEGLAEDFGQAPLDPAGRLDFSRVRGEVLRDGNRFEIRGGLASLDRAGRRVAAGDPPALPPLVALEAGEYAAGDAGLDHYTDAFVWFRFLLAEPARARGFREFLAAVRGGGPPSLAGLEARQPRPLAALAAALPEWILELRRRELVAHGAPPGLPDARGVIWGERASEVPEG